MKRILAYLLFSGVVIFLFFFWLDKIPLWSSDEGRFGEIAREIWESGQLVPLRFNYVDYLQKPAFAYALTALSYTLFGVSSLAARLPSVLSSLSGILLCYFFARKLFSRRTAEASAAILATSIGYVLVGRFALIDMLLTFFLSAALFCLMTASLQNQGKYYFPAYIFMGLAFLTKGLVGVVLPAFIFLAFLIWTKNLQEIKKMRLGWGILIMAAICLPWLAALSLKKSDFFHVFFIQHHWLRFTTKSFSRVRPFWFFIPLFFALGLPWSFFTPAAVVNGLKKGTKDRRKIQFLICWIAVILVFFSIPRSKLPYYILPMSMPFAVLIAALFSDRLLSGKGPHLSDPWVKGAWIVTLLFCLAGFIGVNLYLTFWAQDPEFLAARPFVQLSVSFIFGVILLACFFYKKKKEKWALFSMGGMLYGGLLLTVVTMYYLSPFESTFDYVQTLLPQLKENDAITVYASPDRFSDFPFHLGRRVIIVGPDRGSITEESLKPERAEEMAGWFFWMEPFVEWFNARQRRIFCLMEEEEFHYLEEAGLKDYKVIKKGSGKLLISNQ